MSAECSSCAAPIVWACTQAGKHMPIDPQPVEGGNLEIVGTRLGKPLVAYRQPELLPAGPRYVTHFSTCPDADKHRRKPRQPDNVPVTRGRL